MDMENKKTSVSQLDVNLKNNPETNHSDMPPNIKETINKNKKIIEKTREMLRKYNNIHSLSFEGL